MILVEEPAPHVPNGGMATSQYPPVSALRKLVDKLSATSWIGEISPGYVDGLRKNFDGRNSPFRFMGPADEMELLYELARLHKLITDGGPLDEIPAYLLRPLAENARQGIRNDYVPLAVVSSALIIMMGISDPEELQYAWAMPPSSLVRFLEHKRQMPDAPLKEIVEVFR